MTKHPAYVVDSEDLDAARVDVVGGKGAHLTALARLEGVDVPAAFYVTTAAFRRALSASPAVDEAILRLSRTDAHDLDELRERSAEVRQAIEAMRIPDEVVAALTRALARLDESAAYAVRSSATAEDLPNASFAGQHASFLNVVGREAILEHVRRCWASLFTERAVSYRLHAGFDHRKVSMAVVVQRLAFSAAGGPEVSGVLFTADPLTSNRKVASVEATFGLGEALVSGAVNADVFKVREDAVVERQIATKGFALVATPTGGVEKRNVEEPRRAQPALTDEQVLRLVGLGRRIEAHFGQPQDIEWCLRGGEVVVVQSRPITSLFPIPETNEPGNRVYVSVGHQQMMTDPIKPLGISVWQLTALRPMYEAGGRLFVDVTAALAAPASRAALLVGLGHSDPLIGDALASVVERGFVPSLPDDGVRGPPPGAVAPPTSSLLEPDPDIVPRLQERSEASLAELRREIEGKTGLELFDLLLEDLQALKRFLTEPESHQALLAGFEATRWLNERLEEWLGEKNAADTLAQSAPHNVTSEMGLALLDVADVLRRHPEVVAFLQRAEGDAFLDEIMRLEGGREAREALLSWLERYGSRCVGEIDITRPRFRERPSALLPMLLGNVERFEEGEARRRFERGEREALAKEREVLARLRALDDGERKADETKRMIARLRTFVGYREYPKYIMVCRYFIYRQALLREAARLVEAGVLTDVGDIDFLRFEELREVVRTGRVDDGLIRERKEAFRSHHALRPPRVLTSEGECVSGAYRREDLPAGALVGLAVSSGVVEGRACVVRDIAEAKLEPGDILVTTFTDPSWTPLFVAIHGLVTEVGGLMTHGAVIAREYGLPAVVGVVDATQRILDGQRIRVNGTEGYVEVLSSSSARS